MANNLQPQLPVSPTAPSRERRLAGVPKFSVVDYVLPQVPAQEPAEGQQSTEFVIRPAETQQVASAGYDF